MSVSCFPTCLLVVYVSNLVPIHPSLFSFPLLPKLTYVPTYLHHLFIIIGFLLPFFFSPPGTILHQAALAPRGFSSSFPTKIYTPPLPYLPPYLPT
ncbi:hypothetical protein F4809DRAFT_34440 [Biscogniauxia mediterranea]|nr:hypothetical protein F4809DRAFT_34440 [Biscogniauxia mediterranea]